MSSVERRLQICEATWHVAGCGKMGQSVDHFTPRAYAKKVLGWSHAQINAPENKQYLSIECHREKDRTTEAKTAQALYQKRGGAIRFGRHV